MRYVSVDNNNNNKSANCASTSLHTKTYQKMIEYIKEDRQVGVFLISYFICVHTKNNTLSKEIMNKTLRMINVITRN